MTLPFDNVEMIYLGALCLLSLVDLIWRTAPGIEVFFIGAVLVAAPVDPLKAGAMVLVVAWGWRRDWPGWVAWPFLLLPAAWPVVLVGYGVRRYRIGWIDLLAIGALACQFPWPAPFLALLGLELWRRWWSRHKAGTVPALPGLLLGMLAYLLGQVALSV